MHARTHPFNGPLCRTTQVSQYQKVKPIWILLKQETVSGRGISLAICKSAPHSRQITTPAPHLSVFTGRMPFLPPNQQRQSTEGKLFVDNKLALICLLTRGVVVRERGETPFRQILWSRNGAPANIVGHRWNTNAEAFPQITSYSLH